MTKSIAAACLAISLCAIAPDHASAAVVSGTLALPLAAGSAGVGGLAVGGAGSLAYTYNDANLISGGGSVDTTIGLSAFTLTFGSLVLNGMNTIDAPLSPVLTFLNGTVDSVVANFTDYSFFYASPTYNLLGPTGAVLATGTPVAVTIVPGSFVPEPGMVAMFGLGLAGLAVARRRA